MKKNKHSNKKMMKKMTVAEKETKAILFTNRLTQYDKNCQKFNLIYYLYLKKTKKLA